MIRTKILQFFICYKMSDLKVPKYLFTSFFKVLSQIFIKASLFVHIFTTQLLFSFHEIFVSVTNYHAGFLVRLFYSKISIICHSSQLILKYVCCFLHSCKYQINPFLLYLTLVWVGVWG